jgi:glucose-6-phosphate 1-dehydrogenase
MRLPPGTSSLAPPPPQAIVIFGASGDLATKKIIPALYNLSAQGLLPEHHTIIGFAMSEWDDEAFRDHARSAVERHSHTGLDEETWKTFRDSLTYVSGSFQDVTAMQQLAERLRAADREHGCESARLYYLAVPPAFFLPIVQALGSLGADTPNSRVVVEKPFGHSLDSARQLTAGILPVFGEHQIFRIDHYLGKETVQNLVVFRFANALFERVWNRDAIEHVQITVAESMGIEQRGRYYDGTGAIRDLLQNHILQMLAFIAMEPPRSLEAEAFRDEKTKLLRTIRPIDPADVVRGQYRGYRDEPHVDPRSQTETFVATRVWIDNWRWEGVPFYLRHGKRLPERNTEITIFFRNAPDYLFKGLGLRDVPADHLTIRVQPNEGISLAFQAKTPGPGYELQTVRMDFDYERSFAHAPAEAYERLMHDAMDGDRTLFTRADGVERAWEIVMPAIEARAPLFHYAPGSWGPRQADALLAPHRWHVRTRS